MHPSLKKNAIFSASQYLFIGLLNFFLLRSIHQTLGPRALGIWAIMSSVLSNLGFLSLGLESSMTHIIGKYRSENREADLCAAIQTIFLFFFVFILILTPLLFPMARALLMKIAPESYLEIGSVFPWFFVATLLGILTSIIQNMLDGFRKMARRAFVQIFLTFIYVIMILLTVKDKGLLAIAQATFVQQFFLVFIMLALAHREVAWFRFPMIWKRSVLSEFFSFSLNLQGTQIFSALFDILSKMLLNTWGGLESIGYIDMASRLITQTRAILASAVSAIVPEFAHIANSDSEIIHSLYRRCFNFVAKAGTLWIILLVLFSPWISQIWIGHDEPIFLQALWILGAGWYVNTLLMPSHFLQVAQGKGKWLLIGASLSVMFLLLFGNILGQLFGTVGVLIAISLGIAGRDLLTWVKKQRDLP